MLLGTGCSGTAAGRPLSFSPPQSCLTGQVFAVGTDFAPGTVLRTDGWEEVWIVGELEEEIQRLTGTVLTVCGPRTTAPPHENALEAESYELRSVDGMTAYLGTLQNVEGGWELVPDQGGAPVPLVGVPAPLVEAMTDRVWVAGTWSGEAFSVKSFGVLRHVR
jgi:hypothetical protein